MLKFDRRDDGTYRSEEERWRAKIRFALGLGLVLLAVYTGVRLTIEGSMTLGGLVDLLDAVIQGLEAMADAVSPAFLTW